MGRRRCVSGPAVFAPDVQRSGHGRGFASASTILAVLLLLRLELRVDDIGFSAPAKGRALSLTTVPPKLLLNRRCIAAPATGETDSLDGNLGAEAEVLEQVKALLAGLERSSTSESGQLRAQALQLRWEAATLEMASRADPKPIAQDSSAGNGQQDSALDHTAEMREALQQEALACNAAFYAAFNAQDLGAMGKVWACDVQDLGLAITVKKQHEDQAEAPEKPVCVHPGRRRVEGAREIAMSWMSVFRSRTIPQVSVKNARVLTFSEEVAVVICNEETSSGGLHEAINTFARRAGGPWYMVGHHAGPVMF